MRGTQSAARFPPILSYRGLQTAVQYKTQDAIYVATAGDGASTIHRSSRLRVARLVLLLDDGEGNFDLFLRLCRAEP